MAYEDLLKDTSVADTKNNYFTLTLTDLNPNTSYPIQLRWKYKDGTFGPWGVVKRLAAKTLLPKPSELPSTPTVKPVVGAIELSWNGKTSTGADQPFGFNSAKVYIGTTSNFTPIDSGTSKNQVDILNFANGQNTLNIGVETIVNSSLTLDYGIDYYVKIKTTNGTTAEDSAAVAATGNPVRIGQLSDNGLITISADKITTGTLRANASITVGAVNGKRVILSSGEDPIKVYGSGGTADPLLELDSSGNLLIKGIITATSGAFTGAVSINGTGGAMKIGKSVGKRSDALGLTDPLYDGVYIGTNNYWYNDGFFEVGNGTKGLKWNGSNLIVKGEINSTSGSIGGFTIGANSLYASGLEIKAAEFYGGPTGIASIMFNSTYGMASGFGSFYIRNFVEDVPSLEITPNNNVVVGVSTSPSASHVRNITASTTGPPADTVGDNGDMWAKYV
jgi:hypothetical protein